MPSVPTLSSSACGVRSAIHSVRIQTEVTIDYPGGYDGVSCTSSLNSGMPGQELDTSRITKKIQEQANFCQSFVSNREPGAIGPEKSGV